VAGRIEPHVSGHKLSGGNSAPHKADFGYRAPLTPHLAQPQESIYAEVSIFQDPISNKKVGLNMQIQIFDSMYNLGFRPKINATGIPPIMDTHKYTA
jgi:hypothetical protein